MGRQLRGVVVVLGLRQAPWVMTGKSKNRVRVEKGLFSGVKVRVEFDKARTLS